MVSTSTYRAAVARTFGPPERLRVENLPVAPLPAGAVRVAVRIGGVNPVDAQMRSGSFGGSAPFVPGTEFAGIVTEVARGVSGVSVGDEVVGFGSPGSDADLVVTSADRLVPKPADLSWELAGAVGAVGQTALTVLDGLRLPAGATVLVHGGSGGVGTMIVQLLVADGHTVVATAGADRADYLRELGAIPLAYGPDLPSSAERAVPERLCGVDRPRRHLAVGSDRPVGARGRRPGRDDRAGERTQPPHPADSGAAVPSPPRPAYSPTLPPARCGCPCRP